jgi:hypothetical protein
MIIYLPVLVVNINKDYGDFSLRLVLTRNDTLRLECKDRYNSTRSADCYARCNIIINKLVYLINLYNITRDKDYLKEITDIFNGEIQ